MATTNAHYRRDDLLGGWLIRGNQQIIGHSSVWTLLEDGLKKCGNRPAILSDSGDLSGLQGLEIAKNLSKLFDAGSVGIHVVRSPQQLLLVLGVLCAGAVYVPIATDLPEDKISHLLNSAWLELLVSTDAGSPAGFELRQPLEICNQTFYLHRRTTVSSTGRLSPGDCYVAFTSGSTGAPKGAIIAEDALLNRLTTLASHLGLTTVDRVLFKASTAFDVHIWEMLLPLTVGAAVVVAPAYERLDVQLMARFIRDYEISVCVFIPTLLKALLITAEFRESKSLRAVICGGEAWTYSLAEEFFAVHESCDLYNGYGPTETAIGVANWRVPRAYAAARIELGNPMPNVDFLVRCDTASDLGDIEGELWIGGVQVARGYVGGVHEDRFIEIDGKTTRHRFYRSGDLVKLQRRAGALTFLGRIDHQLKVLGVRVELGEIEHAVEKIPNIARVVALDMGEAQLRRICLLYTTETGEPLTKGSIVATLQNAIAFPAAQIQIFHERYLDALASGKVDRAKALNRARTHIGVTSQTTAHASKIR
jgi:amino acid adenylation domain-containing protein